METAILFAVLIVFVAVCGTCHAIKVGLDGLVNAAIDVRNALYTLKRLTAYNDAAARVAGRAAAESLLSNPKPASSGGPIPFVDNPPYVVGKISPCGGKSHGSVNPPNVRIYPGTQSDDLQ